MELQRNEGAGGFPMLADGAKEVSLATRPPWMACRHRGVCGMNDAALGTLSSRGRRAIQGYPLSIGELGLNAVVDMSPHPPHLQQVV